MRTRVFLFLLCTFALSRSASAQTQTQTQTQTLPTVSSFECPTYPPKAQSMRLQGLVKLEVTTDGHRVVHIKTLPGHPVLVEPSIKNVETWRFADHTPTKFIVTYIYANEGKNKPDPVTKCAAKLDLPSQVKVSTSF